MLSSHIRHGNHMPKLFDNINVWKAALFGGIALLLVGIFHPPTQERVIELIIRVAEIVSASLGGMQ